MILPVRASSAAAAAAVAWIPFRTMKVVTGYSYCSSAGMMMRLMMRQRQQQRFFFSPFRHCHQSLLKQHAGSSRRPYGSSAFLGGRRSMSENPHAVLGVPITSSYEEVRRAFVKLALLHHPDLSPPGAATNDGEGAKFIRIRQAFETIRNDTLDPESVDHESESAETSFAGWSPEQLREWYRQETGEWLTFDMCERTRHEVIRVYKTMSQGGKDKGGYWEMARQLAEREESRFLHRRDDDDDGPLKQLTGSSSSGGTRTRTTTSRRRRRR